MKQALKMPSESTYPYNPFSSQPANICSANGVHVALNANNYYNLSDTQIITLLQNGPLAISVSSKGW